MPEDFNTPEEKLAARRAGSRSNQAKQTEAKPGRTPQDRKPKKVAPSDTIEYDGVIYDVHPEVVDDWEVFEEARAAGDEGGMVMVKAYLGESYDLAKDELRDPETGRLSKDVFLDFIAFVGDEIGNLNSNG